MKDLNIIVTGKVSSGNSYLVYEIRRLLRENGWNVQHDYNSDDNQTEIDLDQCKTDDLDEKIENVKNNSIITLFEKQVNRDDLYCIKLHTIDEFPLTIYSNLDKARAIRLCNKFNEEELSIGDSYDHDSFYRVYKQHI